MQPRCEDSQRTRSHDPLRWLVQSREATLRVAEALRGRPELLGQRLAGAPAVSKLHHAVAELRPGQRRGSGIVDVGPEVEPALVDQRRYGGPGAGMQNVPAASST